MKLKANNNIRVPCKLDITFFQYWLTLLKPYHKLTDKEVSVLANFLLKRYELSNKVSDNDLLDKITLSDEIKKEVQTNCNMPTQYFQVMLSKFRKRGILVDNKINPKFIPRVVQGETNFKLLFLFDFINE